jgi:tetratricopeptide (TPR) repeat protein
MANTAGAAVGAQAANPALEASALEATRALENPAFEAPVQVQESPVASEHHTSARSRSGKHARGRHARGARETSEVSLPVAEQPAQKLGVSAAESVSAASLFERAGAARREGRWLEASGLYRELSARFARSAEARLSLVLVARMQLDRGEPRAALEGFQAYLATSDAALREEALAGRGLAYRRLGNTAEESASVRALLKEYPDSPYGRRALERLSRGAP